MKQLVHGARLESRHYCHLHGNETLVVGTVGINEGLSISVRFILLSHGPSILLMLKHADNVSQIRQKHKLSCK